MPEELKHHLVDTGTSPRKPSENENDETERCVQDSLNVLSLMLHSVEAADDKPDRNTPRGTSPVIMVTPPASPRSHSVRHSTYIHI